MIKKWNAKTRSEAIGRAENKTFDLIIIGGGITGAGIARECALRGISFCLLDKDDFAYGTSSRSSKLFHGGMRYLASYEFGLVREATAERNWLRNHLPHLVRPLGFVYPAYEKSKARPLTVWLAVKLYDIMSDWFTEYKNYRKAKIFRPAFVEEFEPAVAIDEKITGKMIMAGFYYDTHCDDARVTLETIKESLACASGSSVALNYARVDNYIKDSKGLIRGAIVKDTLNEATFKVNGKCVISAAGIWTDQVLAETDYSEPRIFPTKGVHLVVPNKRLGNRNAFSLNSIDDGRFFFVLNRGEVSIIGTTDTIWHSESEGLDQPRCSREDCDYLLRTVNKIFPHAMLTDNDIIATYAGIRPLIRQEGAKHESDVSRKHEIFQTGNGVVAIAGGKSTTFRRMAEDLLFYLVEHNYLEQFPQAAYRKRGYSKKPYEISLTRKEFDELAAENELLGIASPEQLQHFYAQYGRGGIEILKNISEHPQTGQPLLKGYPHCTAEINYILEHENAPKLIDILCRRTEVQWTIWHYIQPEVAEAVAAIMAPYYGWSEQTKQAEIDNYIRYVENTVRFLKDESKEILST